MKRFFCLFIFFVPAVLAGQNENLVLNPGFEVQQPGNRYPSCAYAPNSTTFNKATMGWKTFGGMTPDYIIWEADEYGDCHFPKPHSGNHAIGMINYFPAVDMGKYYDYHEYVFGKLKFPLQPGKAYRVEIFIQQADSTAIDHLERLYSEGHPIVPTSAGNLGICFSYSEPRREPKGGFKPQVIFKEPIVTLPGEWKKLSGTFVADRAYLYFAIGNFFKDENTRVTIPFNDTLTAYNIAQTGFAQKKKRIAYYIIDDISVRPSAIPTAESVITETFAEKEVYVFKNVNFETGKWDLQAAALPELKALAKYLVDNPDKKAEIAGHTDNVGTEVNNQALSAKRAESVYKYLIFNGVSPGRLSFAGYGETQPVNSNKTSEGRRENRRVECRLK